MARHGIGSEFPPGRGSDWSWSWRTASLSAVTTMRQPDPGAVSQMTDSVVVPAVRACLISRDTTTKGPPI